MKLGQTSVVHFISQLSATVIGFLVTIFLARELGSEALGVYYLVIATVSWLVLPSTVGIRSAISKRISEGTDRRKYATAGGLLIGGISLSTVVLLWLFRSSLNRYIGRPATKIVIILIIIGSMSTYLKAVLTGEGDVHIMGVLTPIQTIFRGFIQVGAVVIGAGVSGILLGHAFGTVVSILAGAVAVSFSFVLPERRHFKRLFSFAKYSWLGQLRGRTFNRMDIVVLGFFVQSGLIGVYSISWNIASFLGLFASSMSITLFPELSRLSEASKMDDVRELLQVSISYAGLFHLPGLVGAFLLGDRILRIYGEEFVEGRVILVVLIFAYLINSYNQQVLTALNSVDRPDIAFKSNGVVIVSNVVLNIVLVFLFGWIGAAVATTLSIVFGFIVSYIELSRLVGFRVPVRMIVKQSVSAILMGAVVSLCVQAENTYGIVSNNVVIVVGLVGLGAGIYFLTLYMISPQFRGTVSDNVTSLVG